MRLIALEIKNIRSYRSLFVEFPDGITLLAGDIGAGKSTILLAIEFALFGISRGELAGAALLRHGAADGTVKLQFAIAGREYQICRMLKRSSSGVAQDNGWIEVNGAREQLTPVELRARIFELLHYPLQFLSKQRNLLYRFTIYTPQEEMKSILVQSSEERLETIRRIFGIDAYRIARDNAQVVIKALKDRELAAESLLARVSLERDRLHSRLESYEEVLRKRTALAAEKNIIQEKLLLQESAVATDELQRAELAQKQQMHAMQERNKGIALQELQQLVQQRERREKQLLEIRAVKQSLQNLAAANVPSADEQQLAAAQAELEQLQFEEGKVLGIIEQCRHVTVAGTCPTCKQVVTEEHRLQMNGMVDAQRAAAQKKRERLLQRSSEVRCTVAQMKAALEQRRKSDEINRRLEQQTQTEKAAADAFTESNDLVLAKQRQIAQIVVATDAMLVNSLRAAEVKLAAAKNDLQRQRLQLLETEKQLARLEQETKSLEDAQVQLVAVEQELFNLRSKIEHDAHLRTWVQKQFVPFSATVETHVLASIHASFESVFRQWFAKLVEDDALSTRIDQAFAPIMQQHGYDAEVAHLSGGERTAVSLAYRLALVHTIHLLSPTLGTVGLLLLDEPTDGFSSEQLERVRDVLQELRMGQVIIVSHEQQLEGFVDHILRVRKNGDGSSVEAAA